MGGSNSIEKAAECIKSMKTPKLLESERLTVLEAIAKKSYLPQGTIKYESDDVENAIAFLMLSGLLDSELMDKLRETFRKPQEEEHDRDDLEIHITITQAPRHYAYSKCNYAIEFKTKGSSDKAAPSVFREAVVF